MLNKDQFTNHPIFQPRPAGSIGGAQPGVQARSERAIQVATDRLEVPWIVSKIYRPSPVVNPNPPISMGGGEGMISRIYQQVAPTPEQLEQKKQAERTIGDKIKNWAVFGKFA